MAGVLVRRARRDYCKLPIEVNARKELRDVPDASAERPGPFQKFLFLFFEELRVLLQDGAATRGVRDDRVELFLGERLYVPLRQPASEVANACVNVQGAAAPLFGRDRYFAAVAGQHTDRRIIHTGKGKVCNTAGKEGHTVTPRTDRRDHGPQALREKWPLHPGSEASDARQVTRKKLEQPRGEYQLLQPRPLEEAKELACQLEAPAVREYLVEENAAEETFQVRTLVESFNLSPGRLNQPAVFDARRARRLAGPAVETKIHMPDETFPNRQPPAFHLDHLVDPPARRVHLEAQFAVRGAGVQAEAAVNALRVNVPAGRFARTIVARFFSVGRFYFHKTRATSGDETGVRLLRVRLHESHAKQRPESFTGRNAHNPPKNRPGERTCFGSQA